MPNFLALGLGEILWDILPEGRKLGGAPANFAFNVKALGGQSLTASRVGDDALGHEALSILYEHGMDTSAVTLDPVHPTGRVDVILDDQGVASYHFPNNVAWDFLELAPTLPSVLPKVSAVCFGSLAQRNETSRSTIRDVLCHISKNALKLFDINLRLSFYTSEIIESSLQLANVLKINEEELNILRPMFGLPSSDINAMRTLCERYGLHCAACTRGDKGSLLVTPDSADDHHGEHPRSIVDTIGAGDSFSSVLAYGLYLGWDLKRINAHANKVAAYICTQSGAMNPLPAALQMK